MRYYVTWAPNPDPLYHSAHDSPLHLPIKPPLPKVNILVDGYMLSLAHLIGGRAKIKFREAAEKKGLRKVLKFNGPIMLDSGGFQMQDNEPNKVLELQARFRPNYVVHMDIVGNWKKTVRNAKKTKEMEDSFDFSIYYVVQGRNLFEYKKCAEKLLRLKCEKFAIGNLFKLAMTHKKNEILTRVITVGQIIKNRPFHLLGLSRPDLLSQLGFHFDSFDSASAIRNATKGQQEIFMWDEKKRKMKYFYSSLYKYRPNELKCSCPVCKIFDVFENEYKLPRGTGERRRVRFLRAIHNTYNVWLAAHL